MMHMATKHAQQLVALSLMAGAEAPLPASLSWKGASGARRGAGSGSVVLKGGGTGGLAWGTQEKGVQVTKESRGKQNRVEMLHIPF